MKVTWKRNIALATLVFVTVVIHDLAAHGQTMDGPPTKEQMLIDLRGQVIELEQKAESMKVIIESNKEIIEALSDRIEHAYKPAEPWHTEIIYVNHRMDALASKHNADWALLYRGIPKTEGSTLRGRSQP